MGMRERVRGGPPSRDEALTFFPIPKKLFAPPKQASLGGLFIISVHPFELCTPSRPMKHGLTFILRWSTKASQLLTLAAHGSRSTSDRGRSLKKERYGIQHRFFCTVRRKNPTAPVHVSQHVEPSLLESVDKVNERAGRPGVGHQQEYLRTPELDVGLARVQQEQVLAHLEKTI